MVLLILFCFVGPLIYRTNQTAVNLGLSNLPPGPGHPLGTDEYGIDILGRLMVGGQSSLELGFSVAIASTVIGALYGAISGMVGGVVDAFLMRIVDTLLAVPTFILLLIVASMFTLNLAAIIVLLTVLSWPYVCQAGPGPGAVPADAGVRAGVDGDGVHAHAHPVPPHAAEHFQHLHRHRHVRGRRLHLRPVCAELPRPWPAAARSPTGARC